MQRTSLILSARSESLVYYLMKSSDICCSAFVPPAPDPLVWTEFLCKKRDSQVAVSAYLMNQKLLISAASGPKGSVTPQTSSPASSAVSSRAPSPPASILSSAGSPALSPGPSSKSRQSSAHSLTNLSGPNTRASSRMPSPLSAVSRPPSPCSDSEDEHQVDESAELFGDRGRRYRLRPQPKPLEELGYVEFSTAFLQNAPQNQKIPYPRDESKRHDWTNEQRVHASKADVVFNDSEFRAKVSPFACHISSCVFLIRYCSWIHSMMLEVSRRTTPTSNYLMTCLPSMYIFISGMQSLKYYCR